MCEQFLCSAQKSGGVRQLSVEVKGGFIDPLGMKGKTEGLFHRFKSMHREATGLGPGSFDDAKQLFAKFRLLPGPRFKAD